MTTAVDFAGIKVDNLTLAEAAKRIEDFVFSRTPHLIVTPNPEIIVASQTDEELKNIINSADLRVPDGISMIVVSRILGKPLQERVSGIDLMLKLCEIGAQKKWRIFLLGGAPGIADEAKRKLEVTFFGLKIIGTNDGYFNSGDDSAIIKKIKSAQPDILFVGLGGGKQERWTNRHLKELNVPVCMVTGGSLDVISGQKKRAPAWMQQAKIEWLYRLVTEPQRWKRQLALPKFLWLMFLGNK